MDAGPARHQDALLDQNLRTLFGDIDAAAMALLRKHLEWVEIAAGDALMTQGEPGESMYIMISGRLRAYVRGEDGTQRMVREMSRGQVVGELSLYTDEPRSASVVAIRDSVLVRLPKAQFARLLASSAQVSIALTRQIIQRMKGEQNRPALERPVTIGLVGISDGVDVPAFAAQLAAELAKIGRVRIVDAAAIDHALQQDGAAESATRATRAERGGPAPAHAADGTDHRIALLLDEIEAATDFLLLVADAAPTPWTQRCARHSDELLLIADATRGPALHPIEEQILMRRPPRSEAAEILVLLQPQDAHAPRGTAAWLARRPLAGHVHVRRGGTRDMARLARIQSRTAVGLVLAGGGARGFAHLGVLKALAERGIEIDCVGGTSIGAVMAAYVATDRPLDEVMANARTSFRINPTGDYNLLPLLSLIKGVRLRGVLQRAVHAMIGFDADIEDLWKPYYCVATNYSQAREQLITRGNLAKALLASISIPGALPPVIHEGDLLCDGGTFNNFPVDLMREMRGVGRVIGVDLNGRKPRRIEHEEMPGTWALLRDRLRAKPRRRYRLPSLPSYLMNVTILYSMSRQREARQQLDLYFNPPLERVGMLAWDKFEDIVQQGYAHGADVLRAADAAPGTA